MKWFLGWLPDHWLKKIAKSDEKYDDDDAIDEDGEDDEGEDEDESDDKTN